MTVAERRKFTLDAAAAITDDPATVHLLGSKAGRKVRVGSSNLDTLRTVAAANPDTFDRYAFCVRVSADVVMLDADDERSAVAARAVARRARDLGLRPVVVTSGRPGNIHVFIRAIDKELRDQLCAQAESGGVDVRTDNWVRPPLSVHPGGGYGELLEPSDPRDALAALARPHGATAPQRPQRPHLEVVPPASSQRRPLSAAITKVLRDGDGNPDRSVTFQRIVTAMVNAQWSLDQAWQALTDPEAAGAAKLRDRLNSKGEPAALRYLEHCWLSAQKFCAGRPARGGNAEDVQATLDRLEQQVDSVPWPGAAGSSSCMVMLQMIAVARKANTLTPTVSQRQLVIDSSLARGTVSGALHRLCDTGWLVKLRDGSGPKATLWGLVLEPRLVPVDGLAQSSQAGAYSERPPRRTDPLTHPHPVRPGGVRDSGTDLRGSHDAFRQKALGSLGYRILRYLQQHQEADTATIAAALGCDQGSVSRLLRSRLGAAGLAERVAAGCWRLLDTPLDEALDWAADRFGTAGAGERDRLVHQAERELYKQSATWGRDLGWWDQWERAGSVAAHAA